MAYLERVPGDSRCYKRMVRQVRIVTEVCAGRAALDPLLFGAMPRSNAETSIEADGSMTPLKEVMSAFAAGLYGPSYGPASARQRPQYLEPVQRSVKRWSDSVTEAYRATVRPAAFRRIFLEGGVWHVFIDRFMPPGHDWRSRLEETTDFKALKKDPMLLATIQQAHHFFLRTPPAHPPSHIGSHLDVVRFANTVLHIGERELGLKEEGEKEALLASSLNAPRRLAVLEMTGVNLATTDFLCDPESRRYREKFLTGDDQHLQISFNMEAIQDRVEQEVPNVATYTHRGCPVLYQKTPFNGGEANIFPVMEETMLSIYRTTGALSVPSLREFIA